MKHPAQLRVTFIEQINYELIEGNVVSTISPYPLGFAQAYEPDSESFKSKKKAQDDWAYDGKASQIFCGYSYNEQGQVLKHERVWNMATKEYIVVKKVFVQEHLQPLIIDNIPLSGFRIQKSVSRQCGGNKLWRVLDPRGFELEITTGTLENLMMDCVIDHGLIMSECIWHTGKMLVKA